MKELDILERISEQINGSLDLDRVFQLIVDTLDEVLGFRHSMILLVEPGNKLRVVASHGYASAGIGATIDVGVGAIGVVAKSRRVMRLVGLHMQRKYVAMVAEGAGGVTLPGLADVRSQVAIPMVAKGQLLGVYAVESSEHGAFDIVDERLLGIVGHLIATAIDNARAYRKLEETAAELQRQVAERSRELSEALAKLGSIEPVGVDRVIDGRYRIVRKLGEGGMGAVHEAERLSNGERVAIKTLRGRAEPSMMARFAREAQIAAELRHPNLVPVLDVGLADGILFLVMPLVGGSLEGARSRFGDVAWARPLLAQIATGLAALHAAGIVHRDLKPANVLLANEVAQIADFGLASFSVGPSTVLSGVGHANTLAQQTPLTERRDLFGTPAYMAPELANGVHEAGPTSDIFAFGIVAHEVLAGRRPFAEPPILARLSGRMITPSIDTLLDVRLTELVASCVELDATRRPTALELSVAFLGE